MPLDETIPPAAEGGREGTISYVSLEKKYIGAAPAEAAVVSSSFTFECKEGGARSVGVAPPPIATIVLLLLLLLANGLL